MISRLWKEMQEKRRDNKGAALVMVIIAIAFIGMLVGMILYMAYCNYLMKANDTQAKGNFYTAEYALDVINAGLQQDISEAMSEAYVWAMKNSAGKDSTGIELDFQDKFVAVMKAKLQDMSTGTANENKWYIDYLKSFWTSSGMTVASVRGGTGAYLGTKINGSNTENNLTVGPANAYLTMQNVEVVYTDQKGFVSIIKTDIRVKVPTIGFAQSASKMSIENYSLIANNSLVNEDGNTAAIPNGLGGLVTANGGDIEISGNVFGGYDGVCVSNQSTKFVTNATDAGAVDYKLIADSLNVNNAADLSEGIYVDDTFSTYVQNINLQSSRIDLDGTTYVGNDLDIGGKNSKVTLSGKYYGYGNYVDNSAASSSILINGGNTSLDFSGLEELSLAGHAYVGASKYDANLDRLAYTLSANTTEQINAITSDKIEDQERYDEALNRKDTNGNLVYTDDIDSDNYTPRNETDIMMGESISVKANQLLYMVPPECIGYDVKTGAQVIAKNPMTYGEYELLTTEVEKKDENGNVVIDSATNQPVMEKLYEPVRLSILWNKLNGVVYTNDYKAVYRRVNGTVLVYLYLDFGANELMANEFYDAYYKYDTEGINNYVSSYIADMTWNSNLTDEAKLTLAGNAFYLDRNGEVVFLDDDINDGNKYRVMLKQQEEFAKNHESLMHSLSTQYDAMTEAQIQKQIFYSLVDVNKFASMSGLEYADASGNIKARISADSILYPSTACPEDTKLIVSKGDIFINDDFNGLAVAGGNIYICSGCTKIDYNPSEVLQALRATALTPANATVYAYEIFGASGSLTYGTSGSSPDEDKVKLEDLVVYQNWKKE